MAHFSIISNLYVLKVNVMLEVNHGSQWAFWLDDPQILVNLVRAAKFLDVVTLAGHDAVILLAGTRDALVNAIHDSQ